jgi:hypothetical protein
LHRCGEKVGAGETVIPKDYVPHLAALAKLYELTMADALPDSGAPTQIAALKRKRLEGFVALCARLHAQAARLA